MIRGGDVRNRCGCCRKLSGYVIEVSFIRRVITLHSIGQGYGMYCKKTARRIAQQIRTETGWAFLGEESAQDSLAHPTAKEAHESRG